MFARVAGRSRRSRCAAKQVPSRDYHAHQPPHRQPPCRCRQCPPVPCRLDTATSLLPVLGFAVWALLSLMNVCLLINRMRSVGTKQFFKQEAWAPYDTLTCLFCTIALAFHALLILSGSSIVAATQKLAALTPFTTNPIVAFHDMAQVAAVLESVAAVLVFGRSLKFAGSVPGVGAQLGDAVTAAAAAAKRMASAAVIFIVVTIGFASAACAAFGSPSPKWSTVWESMRTLVTMLFGRSVVLCLSSKSRFVILIRSQRWLGRVWRCFEQWRCGPLRKFAYFFVSCHYHRHCEQLAAGGYS
jgi:hypothetical protein